MSRSADASTRARWLAFAAVTLLGLWILWPVPLGHMPLSKDHTVHLTRTWAWAQTLASGSPRGWSELWFFGMPIGELYPVLGDALVIAVRVLSFGLLDWHQAYALGFTIVFVSQGWAMLRIGRVCKLGELPGLVAAVLLLCDVGAYREGGWIYGVDYGVWPQTLANTLTWLGLAEIVRALDETDPRRRARALVLAALAICGALLSHPITLPVLALCSPLVLLVLGLRPRARFGDTAWTFAIAMTLGGLLAAWWVLPMTSMRGWMVSYGWLWQSLDWMVAQGLRGHLDQGMPIAISVLVAIGLVVVAIAGTAPARLFAACGVLLWVWTAEDSLWRLRLDLFDAGFAQLQWQRFLIAAKPGLLLAAGCALGLLVREARSRSRVVGIPLAVIALGLLGWGARDQVNAMRSAKVGAPQVVRDPDDASLDADYLALAQHLRMLAAADRESRWRVTVVAPRNLHWFMDLPVLTGVGLYKAGFTPGDNFVHKPEADTPALLDRLGVRYVVTRGRARVANATPVAEFGALQLWERKSWQPRASATIVGDATLEILHDAPGEGVVELRVDGAVEGDELVFDIAGYPRWSLTHDGAPIEWIEVPAIGDGVYATRAERRSGALRGGKADGDDGTEPTLVAAPARDGVWRLEYRAWRARDVLALLCSLAAALACLALWRDVRGCAGALDRMRARLAPRLRPWMLVALLAVAAVFYVVRVRSGLAREHDRAVGWLARGEVVRAAHLKPGPLKTDMLVYPAIKVDRRHRDPAVLELADVPLGPRLTGWLALDDDAAKSRRDGKHRVSIQARSDGGDWVALFDDAVAHRPGRRFLELDTSALAGNRVDLRVTITSEGQAPPELGFDLELGAAEP
ncbi:MAG TPA: hypothetical protein VG755_07440 [Nannocystaceae bacterium]|nr:hypothetical protein [Nannocystaceae bacterium]